MVDTWDIRMARIEDCPEVLHNRSSVAERVQMWESILTAGEPTSFTLLASGADRRVVGFASGGRERTGALGSEGELYAIYLLKEAQGGQPVTEVL